MSITQTSAAQKAQIVADMQAITLLASVVPLENTQNYDLFNITYPNGLPAIIIPPPSVSKSSKIDTSYNDRVYSFEMAIVYDNSQLADNGGDQGYAIENIIDAVLNALDNDQTLNGNSNPATEPSVLKGFIITSGDKSWTIIPVVVNAHAQIYAQLPI